MYNKVPSAVDSVGVNSKEKFGIFIFFTVLISIFKYPGFQYVKIDIS